VAGPSPAHVGCWAQPSPCGLLGPAPKKIKKIESVDIKILHVLENYYYFFLNLFTYIRIMNKKGKRKRKYTNFFFATNIYQRQSLNYL